MSFARKCIFFFAFVPLVDSAHCAAATRGHVRDLPTKAGSVKPEDGFAMVYETGRGAARTLGAMAKALRRADALMLATDPEREREAGATVASMQSEALSE